MVADRKFFQIKTEYLITGIIQIFETLWKKILVVAFKPPPPHPPDLLHNSIEIFPWKGSLLVKDYFIFIGSSM